MAKEVNAATGLRLLQPQTGAYLVLVGEVVAMARVQAETHPMETVRGLLDALRRLEYFENPTVVVGED